MAWTNPRTWTDGELVTKAIMDPHIRDNFNAVPHLLAYKSADQTVNNSVTLVNDSALSFAVGASDVWTIDVTMVHISNTTADIKVAFTMPASGVMTLTSIWGSSAGAYTQHNFTVSGTSQDLESKTTEQSTRIYGRYMGGGTAGTLQLQWAQASAQVVDTKVLKGSNIIGLKLA